MDRLSLSEYIQKIIFPAFGITMEVLFFTVIISTIIGFIIAIILDITRSDGMYPNKIFFNIMDTIINLIRSFPFVILMVSLIPLTRFITGSSIGVKAAIFPLCVTMSPYMGRDYFKVIWNKSVRKRLKRLVLSELLQHRLYGILH